MEFHLLWIVLIPIIYFSVDLAAPTYVYMFLSIAFGSIAVGLGLSRMRKQWAIAVLVVAIGLMGFNANYFDIGRTLDPEMSAMKFYNEELPKIPDGDKFLGGGWTWAMVYVYNKEEGRNIVPISIDALTSEEYQGILDDMGIEYDVWNEQLYPEMSHITRQGEMAVSIAKLNAGVWIAKETKPEVYQYVIEPAKGNEAYIGRWIGEEIEPEWKWKPSNPYLFISGQLEIKEWHHILWSNRSMLHIAFYGVLGYGAWRLISQGLSKKKKGKNRT